jgi:hypothetical protein
LASFYANLVLEIFLRNKGTKKSGKRGVNGKAKGIGREVSKSGNGHPQKGANDMTFIERYISSEALELG